MSNKIFSPFILEVWSIVVLLFLPGEVLSSATIVGGVCSFNTSTMARAAIRKVSMPSAGFVSEPSPHMFGNDANPRGDTHWTNDNWLKSLFHFSFAEWRAGPPHFGVLRVLNDDLVQPKRGFGTHGHSNMEIFTLIVSGHLTHQDSMGSAESLGRGSVQFMSAGTGVQHSEFNHSEEVPLRFLQLWIIPDKLVQPRYGSYCGSSVEAIAERSNRWAHLASSVTSKAATPIKLQQDVNIRVAELHQPQTLEFSLSAGRQAYFVSVEGTASVFAEGSSELELDEQDAAELKGPLALRFTSAAAGMWLLVEMKAE